MEWSRVSSLPLATTKPIPEDISALLSKAKSAKENIAYLENKLSNIDFEKGNIEKTLGAIDAVPGQVRELKEQVAAFKTSMQRKDSEMEQINGRIYS